MFEETPLPLKASGQREWSGSGHLHPAQSGGRCCRILEVDERGKHGRWLCDIRRECRVYLREKNIIIHNIPKSIYYKPFCGG